MVRGLAVLPGQVAAAAAEEGIAEALLAALAVVALVVPHARPVAPLRRVVCNENSITYLTETFIYSVIHIFCDIFHYRLRPELAH